LRCWVQCIQRAGVARGSCAWARCRWWRSRSRPAQPRIKREAEKMAGAMGEHHPSATITIARLQSLSLRYCKNLSCAKASSALIVYPRILSPPLSIVYNLEPPQYSPQWMQRHPFYRPQTNRQRQWKRIWPLVGDTHSSHASTWRPSSRSLGYFSSRRAFNARIQVTTTMERQRCRWKFISCKPLHQPAQSRLC
jgi:hypothetical protein